MKKILFTLVLLVMVVGIVGNADAVPLPFNGSINPTGAGSPGTGAALAYLKYNMVGLDANNVIHWTGTLEQWVRTSNTVTGNGTGMVFEYLVTNITGPAAITLEDITDFNGWTTWVDADGTGVNPSSISRATSIIASTISAAWTQPNVIGTGQNSGLIWIETNAPTFQLTGSTTVQGGGQDRFRTYAPAVPEPASMSLLGLGLLGFVGKLRKKFVA